MNRTINVVRLQLINKQTYVWVPLLVLGGVFALTLLIFAMLPLQGDKSGGGAQAPLWYFLVIGIQAMTLSFPFSQAMSITRREFYIGTLLTAALSAAMLSTVFVIGGLVEQATRGYGIRGYFFFLSWIWDAGWWAAWIVYFAVAMFMFVIGFWAATIYKRWGSLWVTIVLVGIGFVLLGVAWLIGRLDAWAEVFGWIGAQGALGLTVWGLLVTALLGVGSYLTLRRATP